MPAVTTAEATASDQPTHYDVAISLRWTDVEHARALYDLLRDRLDVFFADDRQEEFVGTDGEETFGHIFRDQARVVVVFYRPDWGTTPFTRAEEAAIKQRAWKDGYEFTVWVPMGEAKAPPPYVPLQHVWFDFARYGAQGLASVVEARVRASGLAVRPEEPLDEFRRLRRERDTARRLEEYLSSVESAGFFRRETGRILEIAMAVCDSLNETDSDLHFKVEGDADRKVEVRGNRHLLAFSFLVGFSNMARESEVRWKLVVAKEGFSTGFHETAHGRMLPGLDPEGMPAWTSGRGEYYTTEQVVETAVYALARSLARQMKRS